MPSVKYRLYFNHKPATIEQLDRFEDITVSQAIGMAWEAELQLPVVTDEQGKWSQEKYPFIAEFKPLRIEIKVGNGGFIPLIDGPIVGVRQQLSSEPGKSMLTIRVQDDSYYLDREEKEYQFENLSDDEIARQLFAEFSKVIKEIRINDPIPPPPVKPNPDLRHKGTAMNVLRFLAERQTVDAYVLPGSKPGTSIGCFKELPTEIDGLPSLVLLGSDRNVFNFNPSNNAQQPRRFKACVLSLKDKHIARSESDLEAIPSLGTDSTIPADAAVELLTPQYGEGVDLDRLVAAHTLRASYSISATGSVLSDFYGGVLSPYRLIQVCGADIKESGVYLVSKVTHRLTRSQYSQEFTLLRNARSKAPAPNNNVGAIAGAVAVGFSFNARGRIF